MADVDRRCKKHTFVRVFPDASASGPLFLSARRSPTQPQPEF
ncbi:MAG: hypothetical protein ACXAEF_13235 [Candidatus Thorarchaeota archaeon]